MKIQLSWAYTCRECGRPIGGKRAHLAKYCSTKCRRKRGRWRKKRRSLRKIRSNDATTSET